MASRETETYFDHATFLPKVMRPDPPVISESMILAAVEDERRLEQKEAERKADAVSSTASTPEEVLAALNRVKVWEDLKLETLEQLSLSFRRLRVISHLEGLKQLRVLRLDNNAIETIEGLDALENLEWLDLSFNRIERVSGLEKLSKLKDLSLAHNRIHSVEGVSELRALSVLCLGHNRISSLSALSPLRRLPLLRALSLLGNPCASSGDHRSETLARLPHLQFLDFETVDKAETEQALLRHAQLSEALRNEDERLAKTSATLALREKRSETVAALGLTPLATAWNRIRLAGEGTGAAAAAAAAASGGGASVAASGAAAAASEAEIRARFLRMPGMAALWRKYKHAFRKIVRTGLVAGREHAAVLQSETRACDRALRKIRHESDQASREKVATLLHDIKHLTSIPETKPTSTSSTSTSATTEMVRFTTAGRRREKLKKPTIAEVEAGNDKLREDLLHEELKLHEACMAVLDSFDTQFKTFAERRQEVMERTFTELSHEENRFTELARALALSLVERSTDTPSIAVRRRDLPPEVLPNESVRREIGLEETMGFDDEGVDDDLAIAAGESVREEAEDAAEEDDDGGAGEKVQVRISDLHEDVIPLLEDKDAAEAAVMGASDARTERIYALSDEFKAIDKADKERAVERRIASERERHRKRVEEIAAIWAHAARQIQHIKRTTLSAH